MSDLSVLGSLDLVTEMVDVDAVQVHPKNPRKGDLAAIQLSLRTNGFYRPLIVQRSSGHILAGNHTYLAACELGFKVVPVCLIDVDDETASRILVVDNRSADLGTYDEELLVEILQSLPSIEGTGYDEDSLGDLMDAIMDSILIHGDPDEAPAVSEETISKPGDLWILDNHRVACGDSCDPKTYESLLGGSLADAMWTDPPYGVEYVGGTSEALTILNDSEEEAQEVVEAFVTAARDHLRPGAPVYVCHAESQRSYLEGALSSAGYLVRQALVWVKDRFVLSRQDYHNQHEPILVGEAPEKDFEHVLYGFRSGGQGRKGRGGKHWHGDNRQTTVFDVKRPTSSNLHPTMKPVDLIRPMLHNSVRNCGIVLDPFGGSGSTLIAAHMEARRAFLIELDPKYVDVICRRFQDLAKIYPQRVSDGAVIDFTNGEIVGYEEVDLGIKEALHSEVPTR